tara:strand:- start:48 stop:440 length:393 start_codon:yes stop_codon:yes gene_type:complete
MKTRHRVNWKTERNQGVEGLRGYTYQIDDDVFTTGIERRGTEENGFVVHSAEFRLNDGSHVYGAVLISERDSGEHYGTYVINRDGEIAEQGRDDFAEMLGRDLTDIFPYTYRYYGYVAGDHHVGDDGWST